LQGWLANRPNSKPFVVFTCLKIRLLAAVLLVTMGLFLAGVFFIKQGFREATARTSADSPLAESDTHLPHKNERPVNTLQIASTNRVLVTDASPSEIKSSDDIHMHVVELMVLGLNNDQESLKIICSELTNSIKEIRLTAADALVQFGDASVVPYLREQATRTKDLEEQARFNSAAEQLSLPPFRELLRQRNGKH
jgi:hypothetical protein